MAVIFHSYLELRVKVKDTESLTWRNSRVGRKCR